MELGFNLIFFHILGTFLLTWLYPKSRWPRYHSYLHTDASSPQLDPIFGPSVAAEPSTPRLPGNGVPLNLHSGWMHGRVEQWMEEDVWGRGRLECYSLRYFSFWSSNCPSWQADAVWAQLDCYKCCSRMSLSPLFVLFYAPLQTLMFLFVHIHALLKRMELMSHLVYWLRQIKKKEKKLWKYK